MPQALVYATRHKLMPTGISLCFKNNEKLPNNKNQRKYKDVEARARA